MTEKELRRALEPMTNAIADIGFGAHRASGPGTLEFIGMQMRDGINIHVTVDENTVGALGDIAESLGRIASAVEDAT